MTQLNPSPAPAPVKPPFAVQASQFALWAPIASFLLGIAANAGLNKPPGVAPDPMTGTAWMVIGGVNILLNLAALVMGVIALIGIWRQKLKGILLRTVVGMTIASVVLAVAIYLPFFLHSLPNRVEQRLVGDWHAIVHPPGGVKIDTTLGLGADKRVAAEFSVNEKVMKMMGEWRLLFGTGDQHSKLQIRWDAGQNAAMGPGIQWTIEQIDDDQISLLGVNPDGSEAREIYRRVKK